MKQRARKQIESSHANRLGFAVAGTPNRLEYDQGFFVKNGDGAADVKPIAHLRNLGPYALAEHLRSPSAPTHHGPSLAQTQDEFLLSRSPYPAMEATSASGARTSDRSGRGRRRARDVAQSAVAAVYRDIDRKRRATRYLTSVRSR